MKGRAEQSRYIAHGHSARPRPVSLGASVPRVLPEQRVTHLLVAVDGPERSRVPRWLPVLGTPKPRLDEGASERGISRASPQTHD